MECTLSGTCFDEECTTLRCKMFVARKEQRCAECGRTIKKGEEYEGFNGIYGGTFYWVKTCKDCVSLRDAFYPFGGYQFGNIRDEIGEHIIYELNGNVDSSCILPLTPKAKDFVFEAIEEAWED